jgi:hypothetical protein
MLLMSVYAVFVTVTAMHELCAKERPKGFALQK